MIENFKIALNFFQLMGVKIQESLTNESLCKLLVRESIRYREYAEQVSGKLREDRDAIARVAEVFAGYLAAGKGSIGDSVYIPITLENLAKNLSVPKWHIGDRVRDVSIITHANYKLVDFTTSYPF